MLSWLVGDGDRTLRLLEERGRESSDNEDKDTLVSEFGPIVAEGKNLTETTWDLLII